MTHEETMYGRVYRVKADGRFLVIVGFDGFDRRGGAHPRVRNLRTSLLRSMRQKALNEDCDLVDVAPMTKAEVSAWLCHEPLPARFAVLIGPQQDRVVEHVARNLYQTWRLNLICTGFAVAKAWTLVSPDEREAWLAVAKATGHYRVGDLRQPHIEEPVPPATSIED